MSNDLHPSTNNFLNFLSKRLRFYIILMVSVLIGIAIVKASTGGATVVSGDYGGQDINSYLDIITFGGLVTLIPAIIGLVVISRMSSQSA